MSQTKDELLKKLNSNKKLLCELNKMLQEAVDATESLSHADIQQLYDDGYITGERYLELNENLKSFGIILDMYPTMIEKTESDIVEIEKQLQEYENTTNSAPLIVTANLIDDLGNLTLVKYKEYQLPENYMHYADKNGEIYVISRNNKRTLTSKEHFYKLYKENKEKSNIAIEPSKKQVQKKKNLFIHIIDVIRWIVMIPAAFVVGSFIANKLGWMAIYGPFSFDGEISKGAEFICEYIIFPALYIGITNIIAPYGKKIACYISSSLLTTILLFCIIITLTIDSSIMSISNIIGSIISCIIAFLISIYYGGDNDET